MEGDTLGSSLRARPQLAAVESTPSPLPSSWRGAVELSNVTQREDNLLKLGSSSESKEYGDPLLAVSLILESITDTSQSGLGRGKTRPDVRAGPVGFEPMVFSSEG